MSKRIAITLPEKNYLQILAICRVEHRSKAELARILLLSALEQGLRPSQALLFGSELVREGKPLLRLVRGGKDQ